MYGKIKDHLTAELKSIEEAGLFKKERIITSPQGAKITLNTGQEVLNFCANNYLGLSNHPRLVKASKAVQDTHGFGMSSVRFICGTQDIHKTLVVCLSHCLPMKMPSSPIPLTMLRSSMEFVFVRLRGFVMKTPTWKTWKPN
jgi:hypothetical protein